MSKPVLGLLLGALLGAIDGLGAYAYPDVRDQMTGIVIGSTFKGLITGVVAGFVARKLRSLPLGILVGLLVGFALSAIIGVMPDEHGKYHFVEIVIPGSLLGAIVGFATQRFGRAPQPSASKPGAA